MADNNTTRRVAILGGNRIPFARSDGAYANASNQDMFTAVLDGLADRFSLGGEKLDAVIGGAVLKHSRDFNLMRECVLGSSLSSYTPAFDLQQACGTGLQSAIAAADGIARGRYEVAAAGGVDTASDAPIAFGDDLRRALLGLRRARSNVDRLKLVGKLPASVGVEIPVNSEP
ncbi:MAG: acetyl-CoA C-acyltransferase, partial [Actinomycetia bacterium]|nr:acetyl-CoA C-acyltransferase [Actinomycetes bacterium]